MESYLETAEKIYREAAENPQVGLCCTTSPVWNLPGLKVPDKMLSMNYGCGMTVHPRDITADSNILYVGVGGGLELLQFAYFNRRSGGVTGVDAVPEMLKACNDNFKEAENLNSWFKKDQINLVQGNALDLPIADATVDIAAQNCLFNIFDGDDLKKAIAEMYRVLKPHGRLVMSDPVCETPIPDHLKQDSRLRALCLSGALPLHEYLSMFTNAGFGTIEVRARRPYRILSDHEYEIDAGIYIESVEVCVIKDPMPEDGPCIFTGKAAIYHGSEEFLDDGKGHVLLRNQPLAVCDKTAAALREFNSKEIFISDSTWHYDGGGCC